MTMVDETTRPDTLPHTLEVKNAQQLMVKTLKALETLKIAY